MTNPNNNPTPPVSLDSLAVGRSSTNAFLTVFETRSPTSNDVNYPLQQRWYNTSNESEWILTGFSVVSSVKTAVWQPIGNASAMTETLTGNTGGAVGVDGANNINVVGDTTTITIAGNPGTHTLTASTTGSIATIYTENTGTATPSGGNLNVLGTNGITTSGSGSTITITSTNGQILTGIIPDAHTAPGTSPVVPNSSGDITVTGGQVAAGTTANVIQTNSLAANTYTVQVQRSQAVASSTVGDNGVSHFSNKQFAVDSNGFVQLINGTGPAVQQVAIQVFTSTGTYTPTANMVYCIVECLGGGAAGGGAAATAGGQFSSGSGGAGGEYARGYFSAATIGVSQTVTIGAGGTGVSGTTGNAGGTTSLGALITALGGSGGTTSAAGTGTNGTTGASGGSGGTGGQFRNQGGSSGISFYSSTANIACAGYGGQSLYGAASSGHVTDSSGSFAGTAAALYGSGGSGAANGSSQSAIAGGAGSAGLIIITEYIS